MPRRAHPIAAGVLAAFVGVAIFEVTAPWGFVIARQLEGGFVSLDISHESWLVRAPSLFLLELLAGWALYQLLRRTGRFTLGEAVGRHAFITVVLGLMLWPFFCFGLLGRLGIDRARAYLSESWFIGLVVLRAPILFLLALLVGWASYQRLFKTGRFTPRWTVDLSVLVGAIIGLVLGVPFFWPQCAYETALALTGAIGWGAAGATFWALAHDGRRASAA